MVGGLSVVVLGLVVAVLTLVVAGLVVSGLVLAVVRVGKLGGVVVLTLVAHLVLDVVGHNGGVLVVDGTGMGLVLELNVGLLLVEFLVVGVLVVRVLDVNGVLVDNTGLVVVVLVAGLDVLNVVVGLLVVVFLMDVLVLTVVDGLGMEVADVGGLVESGLVMSGLVVGVLVSVGDLVLVRSGIVVSGDLIGDVVVAGGSVTVAVVVKSGLGVVTSVLIDGILMTVSALVMGGEVVSGDIVLHGSAKEDLGEREADGVTELVEVLVLPLSLGVHDLVVHILAVHDQVVLDVEDEVPRVGESLGHLAELVEVSAGGGLALLELVGDIVDDVTKVLNGVEDGVEGTVLELVDDTTESLPDVLGIAEALNTVRNLSLNGASEKTLKDLAHSEEGEVDVGGLHGLEVVHLLVLLVIDLIEKLLPMVIEVVEEFLVVDHLGLAVKEHGGSLAEVLTSIEPLAHAVIVETLTGVLEDVDTVDDKGLGGLEEDLLGMEEGLGHALDLLVVVVVDLTAVVKHVADVRHGQTELVDGLGGLLVGSVPEAAHGVVEVLLDGVGVGDAVLHVGHAVEVEGTDEETLNDTSDLGVVVSVVSLSDGCNHCDSEILEHRS